MPVATEFEDSGIERIARERERQIQSEGYSPEHDDKHANGEIADAAACYALNPASRLIGATITHFWPWGLQWWKPSRDRIRDLEKAGALCAAEIDRLLRLKG